MDKSALPTFVIVLFPIFFVGVWCAISLLLSTMGGWRRLAAVFRAHEKPSGRRFLMQSGAAGLVNYRGCLTIYVSPQGLYLSVWLLFRFGHSPLFIPWEAVRNATTHRFLWAKRIVFDVGSPKIATLQLAEKFLKGAISSPNHALPAKSDDAEIAELRLGNAKHIST